MQALIRPLNELAEFEEISRDIRKGAGDDTSLRMREFPENPYDVCVERWL